MSNDNKFFEDFSKLAGSAMNNAMGSMSQAKEQFDEMVKHKMEILLDGMDLVTREEFDVVQKMAAKSLTEQKNLEKRLENLEETLIKTKEKG